MHQDKEAHSSIAGSGLIPPKSGECAGASTVGLEVAIRRWILAFALAFSLIFPSANAMAPSDTDPPVLIDFDVRPKTVDVSAGPTTVDCVAHLVDLPTGVSPPFCSFSNSVGQVRNCSNASLQSGDVYDGVWFCTVTFEQYDAPGRWKAAINIRDLLNNFRRFGSNDLASMGFPAVLDVVSLTLFSPSATHSVGDRLGRVAADDFNEDGHQDIVTTHDGIPPDTPGYVELMLGIGDGSFSVPSVVGHLPANLRTSLVANDLDLDGHQDLVTTSQTGGDALVRLGDGKGGFADGGAYEAGDGPSSADVIDLNHDAIPDIVTANYDYDNPGSAPVTVLLGNGDGTFADRSDYGFGDYLSIATGEFNQDEHVDLV